MMIRVKCPPLHRGRRVRCWFVFLMHHNNWATGVSATQKSCQSIVWTWGRFCDCMLCKSFQASAVFGHKGEGPLFRSSLIATLTL